MAKYKEFDTVILNDGRHASVVEVYEPGIYDVTVGRSPTDWNIIYGLTDDDIDQRDIDDKAENGKGN
jgi:hypothetical protein